MQRKIALLLFINLLAVGGGLIAAVGKSPFIRFGGEHSLSADQRKTSETDLKRSSERLPRLPDGALLERISRRLIRTIVSRP